MCMCVCTALALHGSSSVYNVTKRKAVSTVTRSHPTVVTLQKLDPSHVDL